MIKIKKLLPFVLVGGITLNTFGCTKEADQVITKEQEEETKDILEEKIGIIVSNKEDTRIIDLKKKLEEEDYRELEEYIKEKESLTFCHVNLENINLKEIKKEVLEQLESIEFENCQETLDLEQLREIAHLNLHLTSTSFCNLEALSSLNQFYLSDYKKESLNDIETSLKEFAKKKKKLEYLEIKNTPVTEIPVSASALSYTIDQKELTFPKELSICADSIFLSVPEKEEKDDFPTLTNKKYDYIYAENFNISLEQLKVYHPKSVSCFSCNVLEEKEKIYKKVK